MFCVMYVRHVVFDLSDVLSTTLMFSAHMSRANIVILLFLCVVRCLCSLLVFERSMNRISSLPCQFSHLSFHMLWVFNIGIWMFILICWPLPFSVASAWACDGQNLKKGSKGSLGRSELKPGCFADSYHILVHAFHRSNLVESTTPSNDPNSRYRTWNRSGLYLWSPRPRLKRGGHQSVYLREMKRYNSCSASQNFSKRYSPSNFSGMDKQTS